MKTLRTLERERGISYQTLQNRVRDFHFKPMGFNLHKGGRSYIYNMQQCDMLVKGATYSNKLKRGDVFLAIHKQTGRAALYHGLCTFKARYQVKNPYTQSDEYVVYGVDQDHHEREFKVKDWHFLKR